MVGTIARVSGRRVQRRSLHRFLRFVRRLSDGPRTQVPWSLGGAILDDRRFSHVNSLDSQRQEAFVDVTIDVCPESGQTSGDSHSSSLGMSSIVEACALHTNQF